VYELREDDYLQFLYIYGYDASRSTSSPPPFPPGSAVRECILDTWKNLKKLYILFLSYSICV
jgi:hypothetical protein